MMIIFLIVIVVVIVIVNRRTAMKIEVFCTDERTMHTLTVSKTSTVLDVKTAVMAVGCCIPIANQQLSLGRRILLDDDPLSLYKIKKIVSYGWTGSPHHLRLRRINHLRLRRINHLRLCRINQPPRQRR